MIKHRSEPAERSSTTQERFNYPVLFGPSCLRNFFRYESRRSEFSTNVLHIFPYRSSIHFNAARRYGFHWSLPFAQQ